MKEAYPGLARIYLDQSRPGLGGSRMVAIPEALALKHPASPVPGFLADGSAQSGVTMRCRQPVRYLHVRVPKTYRMAGN